MDWGTWEQEVRYNQARIRAEAEFDIYSLMRKWRRRAFCGWFVACVFGIAIVILAR